MGDLSKRAGMTAPTTVVAIRRMVENGLVVRKPDDRDHREVRIHLTGKGRRFRDKLLPLECFQEKWAPVFRPKTRRNNG